MKKTPKKIVKHIKNDIKEQSKMMKEDKELLKSMATKSKSKPKDKMKKVIEEYEDGTLRSGSKTGPKVKKKSQALAIGYSEKRKAAKKKK